MLSTDFAVPEAWPGGCTAVFSPQRLRNALDRYIASTDGADAVLVTLAFSIVTALAQNLKADSDGLRYVLMHGIKGNKKQVEKISAAVRDIRTTEAGRVAIGAYLRGNALDQFLVERSNTLAKHVQFIHTTCMLVNPLGTQPLVITGSANFSLASCTQEETKICSSLPATTGLPTSIWARSCARTRTMPSVTRWSRRARRVAPSSRSR